MMANMVDTESTQILDEITINEIGSIKKPTFSSFTDNSSPILGDVNAPLTLIEFGDYQCTFCNKFFHETVDPILTNYVKTGKVKILFKDFIVVGQDSMHAANAAHCANDQQMFWQYHSILYNNWAGEGTGWVSSEQLNKFANTLELDMDKFSSCVSELKWKKLVHASHDDGVALGVTATPTFFVIDQNKNVMKITGAQQYDIFKEVFDSSLEK
jgi:protein-disulfide isomerase